jgi:general transcription factor 3C polypeptide 5 (transcription factor C subunit 1)
MADFQINYDMRSSVPRLIQALIDCDTEAISSFQPGSAENETALPAAPAYSRINVPISYGFKQAGAETKPDAPRKTSDYANRILIRFGEMSPDCSAEVVRSRDPANDRERRIQALFEERPVWTRLALENRVPECSSIEMRHILIKYAYMFSDGPWRQCWVRFGYNPQEDRASRFFQLLDIRSQVLVRPPENQWVREKRPNHEFPETFTVTLERGIQTQLSSWYQICDLKHPLLVKLAHLEWPLREQPDVGALLLFYCKRIVHDVEKGWLVFASAYRCNSSLFEILCSDFVAGE